MSAINREEWLTNAIGPLSELINTKTDLHVAPANVQVSCGWPRNDARGKVIGQCFTTAAGRGASQLFISPLLDSPVEVLATLLHELIHAADDCKHGHKAAFARAAKTVGLSGKPTHTFCEEGSELEEELTRISINLGEYPHGGMDQTAQVIKKQSTRMIKCECDNCGYVVRTTNKWLDIATPVCPDPDCDNAGLTMVVEEK